MYYVYAWRNTGYNTVNLPDSPARLILANSKQFPAIDYVQNSFLNSIQIRASFEDAATIDYIAVSDGNSVFPQGATFYVVTDVKMTSKDVASLSVMEDFITTAGGLEHICFNGGMITRRSITAQENVFGKFTLPDEYLQLNEEPLIRAAYISLRQLYAIYTTPEQSDIHITESTVKLDESLGKMTTTTDTATGTATQVPDALPVPSPTQFAIQTSGLDLTLPNSTQAASYKNVEQYSIQSQALAKLRARGLESAIVSSYSIPAYAYSAATSAAGQDSDETTSRLTLLRGIALSRYISGTPLNNSQGTSTQQFNYAGSYARIYIGDVNRVSLMTASGSKLEARPEEICIIPQSGVPHFGISVVTDIRSTGRPYFSFSRYHNMTKGAVNLDVVDRSFFNSANGDFSKFFMFCVEGAQWRQVPLVWRGASGSDIIKAKYNLQSASREARFGIEAVGANFAERQAQLAYSQASDPLSRYSRALGGLSGMPGFNSSFTETHNSFGGAHGVSNMTINPANMILGSIGMAANAMNNGIVSAYGEQGALLGLRQAEVYSTSLQSLQSAQRNEELYSLGVQLNNVAPTVGFAGDDNTVRDAVGNGVLFTQYIPTSDDLQRMNTVLARFGHKVYEPIAGYKQLLPGGAPSHANVSDVVNGIYYQYKQPTESYDYLQVSGASIGWAPSVDGNTVKNKGMAERVGIASQLSGGIRFWHQDVSPWNVILN